MSIFSKDWRGYISFNIATQNMPIRFNFMEIPRILSKSKQRLPAELQYRITKFRVVQARLSLASSALASEIFSWHRPRLFGGVLVRFAKRSGSKIRLRGRPCDETATCAIDAALC
ncbi:Hypothetical_protein [Hexamita inflata]|uniref:Hypothetical_protein n=1 Tax=Hexamita inflata TaxID=28002 RepID=A0ABP1KHS7_9EUKA